VGEAMLIWSVGSRTQKHETTMYNNLTEENAVFHQVGDESLTTIKRKPLYTDGKVAVS